MARTKLKKLKEVENLPIVFAENENVAKEIRNYFGNENPLTLEIGCGHGDYSVELAQKFPYRNFLGIDLKGNRIWTAAKKALDTDVTNVAFLISRAEKLLKIFQDENIEEIFIPFPDPHVKRKHKSRRLISTHFLKIYKMILNEDGVVHFKTDNQFLFDFFKDEVIPENDLHILEITEDLYSSDQLGEVKEVKTFYEKYYLEEGRRIKYISFKFK